MKAISLWNPFAWLIAHGHKKVETRSWMPPRFMLRPDVRFAIHAAKKWDGTLASICQNQPFFRDCLARFGLATLKKTGPAVLGNGRLLATCRIAQVVPTAHVGCLDESVSTGPYPTDLRISRQERAFGDYSVGRYAWVLEDIRPIKTTPEAVGAQGFFEVHWEYDWEYDWPSNRP